MEIKGLQLKGFKSFPDTIEISFDSNITAIVGPNGSGKSNIVDSIRWVLGEQSAKTLRGSKMDDLIFSGTDQRRSKNQAMVTLILDNSNGELPIPEDTVRISRKVTANGSSTYLVNDEAVRLKDIENLLIDGGMRKDSSSILGQGKIDTMLMSKPADRRELFEEAAGIIKYKIRKKEALNKLEHTSQQSRRIRDIIHELNRQARPLKKQARTAKKYKKLAEELNTLEINLLLKSFQEKNENLSAIEEKIKETHQTFTTKKDALDKDLRILENKEDDMEKVKDKLNEEKEKAYRHQNRVEMLESKMEISREKIKAAKSQLEEKRNDIKRISQHLETKENEKEKSQLQLNKITQESTDLEEQLHSFSQEEQSLQENWEALHAKREELRSSIRELLNKSGSERRKLQEVEGQVARIETRIQEVHFNKEDGQEKKATLEKELQEIDGIMRQKKEMHYRFQEKLNDIDTEITDTEQKLKKLKEDQERTRQLIKKLQGRITVLEKAGENLSSHLPGVDIILKEGETGNLEGILGTVGKLFSIENGYETAIETALGNRLQNIVTRTDEDAEAAINMLKERKGGRVTFLPLNLIKPRALQGQEKNLLKKEGVLGTALEFIRYPDDYQRAFANLFGRVLICQDLKSAVQAARESKGRLKVVTMEGDVINPGGSITGGEKRISRYDHEKEIKDLKEKVRREELTLSDIERDIKNTEKDLKTKESRKNKLQQEEMEVGFEIKSLEKDKETLKSNIAIAEENLKQVDKRYEELQEALTKHTENMESIQLRLEDVQSKYQENRHSLQDIENNIEKQHKEQGTSQGQLFELRIELAGKKQKMDLIKEQQEKIIQEIEEKNREYQEKEGQLGELLDHLDSLENNISKMEQEKAEQEKLTEESKKEAELIEERKEKLAHELKILSDNVKKLQKLVETQERELNNIRIEETKILGEIDNIKDRLEREFDLSPEKAHKHRDEKLDLSNAQERIKELKDEIRALGPVNIAAIEEYEELEKRLIFMKDQHKDLREAQDTLNRIIDSINTTMASKFLQTFKKVAKEFEIIFRKLFQGGTAELYLSNEDNLLETGVEVVAQPPGKKLQKLSLMSGGEKALAAIALLFALMKVKPCPFYVLDEIDAPLDDANVDRFVSFLRDFSKLSQFIIITHRKRTIAEADTIYGITMEEAGVSKIISYKLKGKAS